MSPFLLLFSHTSKRCYRQVGIGMKILTLNLFCRDAMIYFYNIWGRLAPVILRCDQNLCRRAGSCAPTEILRCAQDNILNRRSLFVNIHHRVPTKSAEALHERWQQRSEERRVGTECRTRWSPE